MCFKNYTAIYCLQEIHFDYNVVGRLKVKECKMIGHAMSISQKKVGKAIPISISNKVDQKKED